ncbi:hypothetical protein S7711_06956 [Stachybotrys chartarum IBT 7711]|uniref:Ribosomal protein L1 n=1 Tax=Stachybotrys chartarum (strain CBS 109288 / IBT 7711) TaxID=1280523 RepID=A0A084ARW6_STACB|nr:hypothetical protein S7711_06956 [Stachybotrys chartarum IBT 7711]
MAPIDRCLASMARVSLSQTSRPSVTSLPRFLAPTLVQSRHATVVARKAAPKKRTIPKDFKRHNLKKREFPQYSLCEAMRILRAFEVGKPPTSVKYELHINLKTFRSGPVVKNSVRLPFPVQNDVRIGVICPEDSDIAKEAIAAGAAITGEESLFQAIREERFDFDRLLCHSSSEAALNKAALGKILGPRGLMPNQRMKTIVDDVGKSIRESAGAADFRERQGVIRLAIGQLRHSPEQLKANIQTVLRSVKTDCGALAEDSPKEVHEVIISSTNGPGISLSGKLTHEDDQVTPEALQSVM